MCLGVSVSLISDVRFESSSVDCGVAEAWHKEFSGEGSFLPPFLDAGYLSAGVLEATVLVLGGELLHEAGNCVRDARGVHVGERFEGIGLAIPREGEVGEDGGPADLVELFLVEACAREAGAREVQERT